MLHWLYQSPFTEASERRFKDAFDLSRGSYELSFVNSVQKLLSMVMLRRTKAVVEASVPPREELTVFIPLSEAQRFWYYRLLTRMDTSDLVKIFDNATAVNVENGAVSEGRKEVLLNLESHVERGLGSAASSSSGASSRELSRTFFIYFSCVPRYTSSM